MLTELLAAIKNFGLQLARIDEVALLKMTEGNLFKVEDLSFIRIDNLTISSPSLGKDSIEGPGRLTLVDNSGTSLLLDQDESLRASDDSSLTFLPYRLGFNFIFDNSIPLAKLPHNFELRSNTRLLRGCVRVDLDIETYDQQRRNVTLRIKDGIPIAIETWKDPDKWIPITIGETIPIGNHFWDLVPIQRDEPFIISRAEPAVLTIAEDFCHSAWCLRRRVENQIELYIVLVEKLTN